MSMMVSLFLARTSMSLHAEPAFSLFLFFYFLMTIFDNAFLPI